MSWKNRIVESTELPVEQLAQAAHPGNWRVHPKYQQAGLKSIMDDIGIVQSVVLNRRSVEKGWPEGSEPVLVDGHLRVDLAAKEGIDSLPVVVVDLDEEEEGVVLATLDPLGELAKHDTSKLGAILARVADNRPKLADLFERISGQLPAGINYTPKVESPVYEPALDPPPVELLVDRTRVEELQQQINAVPDLPDEVATFLYAAATRHLRFDYRAIADYYAHAPKEVQQLMEASALVIIDFRQAIEEGYVKLADRIRKLYLADHG